PGREWVPGNWVERKQGFQWVSGYWADREIEEAEYLPEPPKSIEEGPNMDAPSPDYAWVPGCWVWLHGNYGWRPGYWTRMRPDWVWVPAYYSWTPRGYIFAGGYWDFAIARRGVLFAPVYFYPRFFTRIFFPFTPGFVIGLNVFSDCIFVRPAYRHYYFGNYYASKYHRRGIYPWFSRSVRPHGYDPIYAHQRYNRRNDSTWEKDMQAKFNGRRDLEDKGPQTIENGKKNDRRKGKSIVKNEGTTLPIKKVEKNKDNVLREYNMKKDDRRKKVDQKNVVKENRRTRKEPSADTVDQSSRESVKGPKPIKAKSSRNEVVSKKVNEYDNKTSSYKNHTAPKPNPVANPVQEPSTDLRLKNRNHKASRLNPEAAPVQETSNEPRLKDRNHGAYRPSPETAPVQETINEPRLGNRNQRQISRDQEQEIIDQSREDRELNSVKRGNRPATRGQKAYGQGRYSDDGRRNMGNRQWMYNGRR
ncbi:MAG: YXWGXW repeat-containing protein, partial [Desulfobacterales bacterium]|nr:YXWGXW repeat-containing protein [Desulfobacterales bacterium]